ncbi:hypothetical protein RRG08_031890 [Elysia crispata]|uniref:Uncharacterized protein n=1 Tax=Elysia crispata TaxID=231223 RepID=A0AAE1AH07_9GAST|nr:hypothetical protein RRG08_031890 [Elysia crispata]
MRGQRREARGVQLKEQPRIQVTRGLTQETPRESGYTQARLRPRPALALAPSTAVEVGLVPTVWWSLVRPKLRSPCDRPHDYCDPCRPLPFPSPRL